MKLRTLAILFLVVGIALAVASFILPPLGVIDNSVLTVFGEIIAAAGVLLAWHAVDKGIDAKVQHGNTTIDLQNPDNK